MHCDRMFSKPFNREQHSNRIRKTTPDPLCRPNIRCSQTDNEPIHQKMYRLRNAHSLHIHRRNHYTTRQRMRRHHQRIHRKAAHLQHSKVNTLQSSKETGTTTSEDGSWHQTRGKMDRDGNRTTISSPWRNFPQQRDHSICNTREPLRLRRFRDVFFCDGTFYTCTSLFHKIFTNLIHDPWHL